MAWLVDSMRRRLGSSLLRICLWDCNGAGRFILDSLVTPSAYLIIERLSRTSVKELQKNIVPFEEIIFPVLHPSSSTAVELHLAERNLRFRTWVRRVYLEKVYGDSSAVREAEFLFLEKPEISTLRSDTERNNSVAASRASSARLPTFREVEKVFGMQHWERNPSHAENHVQKNLVKAYERRDPSIKTWSLENLLESFGCCLSGTNEFNYFCEKNFVYELHTIDYMKSLHRYLLERINEAHLSSGKQHFTVLEVGAGSGHLSSNLQRLFDADSTRFQKPVVKVVATDVGVWRKRHKRNKGGELPGSLKVEKLDFVQALQKHSPDVVICSWMPMNEDWTSHFRRTPSVLEYLLIGEIDDGCCGHPWLTWGHRIDSNGALLFSKNQNLKGGNLAYIDIFHWLSEKIWRRPDLNNVNIDPNEKPPYVADSFSRHELPISDLQVSRYDRKHYAANSKTVSFRRQTLK